MRLSLTADLERSRVAESRRFTATLLLLVLTFSSRGQPLLTTGDTTFWKSSGECG
jgi:hypothetical protein